MQKTVAVLAGDGIGPEVMEQALRVLSAALEASPTSLVTVPALVGGAAYQEHQSHFPEETKAICEAADAILFGSVGGPHDQRQLPKWNNCEAKSILAIRKHFSFCTNLRPVCVYPELSQNSPLKAEILAEGVDILFVRELVGDIYFGEHHTVQENGRRVARDVAEYTEDQIATAARAAFAAAETRGKKLTSVDKANVLDTSRLWRAVVDEIAEEFPSVSLDHLFVDNCAMQLILNPTQFDVVVTANLFGDILSDAAGVLPGSLGLIPSASLNASGFGLYEPAGGSAPDLTGKNLANPIAQILSAALMLRYSLDLPAEAAMIEAAVRRTIVDGYRTADIAQSTEESVGTVAFTEAVLERIKG